MITHIYKWERVTARTFLAAIMVLLVIALSGCGDDGYYYDDCYNCWPPTYGTVILSDPALDGDIRRDPGTGLYTITQGNTQSVYVGIDPAIAEYRAFLSFPLRYIDGIPFYAVIVSATIDMVIDRIDPLASTIPICIDLISLQSPTLIGSDFDRTSQPALATMTLSPPISQADLGHIVLDVTPLLIEAQRLGLANFQIRILREEILPVSPGLIEINDTTGANRMVLAPLLQVTYY